MGDFYHKIYYEKTFLHDFLTCSNILLHNSVSPNVRVKLEMEFIQCKHDTYTSFYLQVFLPKLNCKDHRYYTIYKCTMQRFLTLYMWEFTFATAMYLSMIL